MKDYNFGNYLHNARKKRGLSQYQLGKLVGVSDKAVSKWENGYSKPQSKTLYKLSSVLGITVDELLSCNNNTIKKDLWKKAYQALLSLYGDTLPVEISNRYFSEYAELNETDIIIYFDLISQLNAMSNKLKQHIRIEGSVGCSFIAYILGATETNPLPPHYFCPHCKNVVFDNSVYCGWDLPKKHCTCGKEYLRDGHNLPFETLRFSVHKNTHFILSCSNGLYKIAKEKINTQFDNVIELLHSQELDKLCLLEKESKIPLNSINFIDSCILKAFQHTNTDGIDEFEGNFIRNLINELSPKSYHDLIQILGAAHSTHNGLIVNEEISVSQIIVYRDDIFNYIQNKISAKKLSNTGLAHKIMDDIRRGIFAKEGISQEIKNQLTSLGIEDCFIKSIENVKYLFPKAHGVVRVKYALIFMWYKLNCPAIFEKILYSSL